MLILNWAGVNKHLCSTVYSKMLDQMKTDNLRHLIENIWVKQMALPGKNL